MNISIYHRYHCIVDVSIDGYHTEHLFDTFSTQSTSVLIYAYSNNEADTAQYSGVSKEFIPASDLLDLYQDDKETKSPSSFLEGW